jgi:Ca2+-binding EF-hand superfamily protein
MFRNAEYILALKDLMNLRGKATLDNYIEAFDRLDTDGSGYIDSLENQELFEDVYKGWAPSFKIETFLKFFDRNNDGRISW